MATRGRPRKIESATQWEEPSVFGLSRSSVISGIIAIVVIVGLFVLFNALPGSQPAQPADEQTQEDQTSPEEKTDEAENDQDQNQDKQPESEKLELPTIHTVGSGESLWKISEKYYGSGYGWVKIAGENKIVDANSVEIGQKLTIPKTEIKSQTHTVVKGDTLWDLSEQYYGSGYQWQVIAQANAGQIKTLPNGNLLIIPGQKLSIP